MRRPFETVWPVAHTTAGSAHRSLPHYYSGRFSSMLYLGPCGTPDGCKTESAAVPEGPRHVAGGRAAQPRNGAPPNPWNVGAPVRRPRQGQRNRGTPAPGVSLGTIRQNRDGLESSRHAIRTSPVRTRPANQACHWIDSACLRRCRSGEGILSNHPRVPLRAPRFLRAKPPTQRTGGYRYWRSGQTYAKKSAYAVR